MIVVQSILHYQYVAQVLLSANLNNSASAPAQSPAKAEEKLAITPNYIRNPVLAYKVTRARGVARGGL